MIEKVEEKPVLAGPDRVADRRRVGGDDQALARHRLEERPGEHEGIGVVDMCPGERQGGEHLAMRQRPGEMDPRRIDSVLYLVQEELLPSRPFRRRQPVPTCRSEPIRRIPASGTCARTRGRARMNTW